MFWLSGLTTKNKEKVMPFSFYLITRKIWSIFLIKGPLSTNVMTKLTLGKTVYVCSVEALTSKTSDSRPVMEVNYIKSVISHESLCASYMRSRFFLPCAYRLEVKYCWVLSVRYTISCYITKFRVHYTSKYGRHVLPELLQGYCK